MDEQLEKLLELYKENGSDNLSGPDAAVNTVRHSTDTPKSESDAKLILRLQKMLKQAKNADSRWRKRSKENWEFYDNEQWTAADKEALRQRRQAPIVINRIAPTVDLVVGLQVTQPMDWVAKPVGLNDDGVADAMSAALKFVARQNNAFNTMIDAYRDSLIYGIGWVNTGFHIRNSDPRTEPVQMMRIDPREVRLDPQSKLADISDARFVIWSRRIEFGDALRAFPKLKSKYSQRGLEYEREADLIEGRYQVYDGIINLVPPPSMWDQLEDWNMFEKDDYDSETQHVTIHELWEKTIRRQYVMEFNNGVVQTFDPADDEAMATAMSASVRRFYEADVPFIRYHVFSGTTLLMSEESPYKHHRFPFVPVWHKRDRNGDPFSMVETLKDPQREINHRRSRLLWELISSSVRISQKAFAASQLTLEEVQTKAARPDAIWVGDADDIDMMPRPNTASSQFQLMQDAKQEIQSVSGMNDDLMGFDSSSRSGKAKQISMIQGATIQRPKEANLHMAHKIAGELVMQLIQQAHTDEWLVRVTDDLNTEKVVHLNSVTFDEETGEPRILNDITQARFDLAIEEAPWTPTQRDRAMEMLTTMAESEPDPVLRNALHQAAIMAGDIPFKAKVLSMVQAAKEQSAAAPEGAVPPSASSGAQGPQLNPSEQALQIPPEQLQSLLNPGLIGGGPAEGVPA